MLCPRCGALSPEGSRFCFECGALLPDAATPGGATAAVEAFDRVPRMPWLLVLLLDCLTLGLYGPCWFLRREPACNALGTARRLHPGLLATALLGRVASLFLACAGLLEIKAVNAGHLPTFMAAPIVEDLQGFLECFVFAIMVHQSLRLRAMLKDHHLATTGRRLRMGWLWTILFQEIALQRGINRMHDDQ